MHRNRWVRTVRETAVPIRLIDGPSDPNSGPTHGAALSGVVEPDVVMLDDDIAHCTDQGTRCGADTSGASTGWADGRRPGTASDVDHVLLRTVTFRVRAGSQGLEPQVNRRPTA